MATDKSEPRIGLIFKVGALAIVTLIATHAALVTYFDRMARGEELRKIGSARPEALMSVRADEKQRLSSGPMPIDKAMDMLKQGRAISPDIMPSASPDTAPMQGWVKMPSEVPMPMMAAQADASAPAPSAVAPADAGVSAKPDAAAAGDGAPPAPKHPHKAL
jgi:hypothetical protein